MTPSMIIFNVKLKTKQHMINREQIYEPTSTDEEAESFYDDCSQF